MKDTYEISGISEDSTDGKIRKFYSVPAKKYYPEMIPDKNKAEIKPGVIKIYMHLTGQKHWMQAHIGHIMEISNN